MGCPTECVLEETLTFSICTHDPDTGVLTDADAVPSYRIYEDKTEVPLATGNMAKLDDANTTGFYSEQITVAAVNGYEATKSYSIYIQATVDGDTGGIVYSFKALAALPPTAAEIKTAIEAGGGSIALIKVSTDALASINVANLNTLSGHDPGATLVKVADIPTAAAIKTAMEAAGGDLALILEDTGTTLPATLTTINGYVDDLEGRLTATRAGYLDYLLNLQIALINKMIVREVAGGAGQDPGDTEQFNDAGGSLGTIDQAFTSDGTFTTRKRMVI